MLQNIHRYFMYIGVVFIVILSYDAWVAMWFPADGSTVLQRGAPTEFGIGVGTIVLVLNAVFLACWTFGCHSLRHLVGGVRDVLSGRPVREDGLPVRELPQSLAHELGVGQLDLGGLR